MSSTTRIVSRSEFRNLSRQDPSDEFAFDENGELCIVEEDDEAEAAPTGEEAARIEHARRASEFMSLSNGLLPSEYLLYLGLKAAIASNGDAVKRRIGSRSKRLLVAAKLPSETWFRPVDQAWLTAIAGRTCGHLEVTREATTMTVAGIDRHASEFERGPLLRGLQRKHVLAAHLFEKELPDAVRRYCDFTVDLARPDPRDCALAVARAFGQDSGREIEWPASIELQHIDAKDFDAVLDRADNPTEAIASFVEISAHRARAEAEKPKEPEKKKTGSKKATDVEIIHPTSPRVEDLYGYGDAAAWALSLAKDIDAYRRGELGWTDIDAGCLLYGPPGTGKTMLASAIAASAGVSFIPTSYSDWQSRGQGYAGDVVKAIRCTFEAANEASPCIVFIDEIDTVPARGTTDRHDDWWTVIVAALLEALDGTNRREGVVVIGACNNVERLDPALVRSGRLDRRFEIGLPDEEALGKIFAHHLPGADPSAFEAAATVLAGSASGADVARLAREARRTARRQQRDVTVDDILRVALPDDPRTPERQKLVAVHEAGHAIAFLAYGRLPESLSIVVNGLSGGSVRSPIEIKTGRLKSIEQDVVVMLAGRAAEEVVFGEATSGATHDLSQATAVVSILVGQSGLGGRLVCTENVDTHIVEAKLRDLYGRALRLLGDHRVAVEKLADLALEKRVLGRRALQDFAREHGFGGGS